ncbi:hypothetical protein [Lysinibacillus sphaericus]|uniref:hypothetical protein n=1 Tax=Lysinibacillus sphaericus TaxID=1421 RepID=UPI003CFC7E1D
MRTNQLGGRSTDRKSPIGSTNNQWGMKKTPTDWSFTLFNSILSQFVKKWQQNNHCKYKRAILIQADDKRYTSLQEISHL